MALTDSLVSYWSLDEASGNAIDAHGSNDLTETSGTIAAATGKVGGARDFEAGDSEYFEHADNSDLSTGDIDFTFTCWVQFESLGAVRDLITKWTTTAGTREYILIYNSATSRFEFYVSSNGTAATAAVANTFGAPTTATWYFVVCWHDSVNNVVGISINAGAADTVSHSAGVLDTATAFRLGARADTPLYHDGLLDEVGFWKRVLTSDERTYLYNGGNGRPYPFSSVLLLQDEIFCAGLCEMGAM